jgi:Ca2+-binding RTX toxin-like protein
MATKNWNDGTGDWDTAGNWSPTGVPAPGDNAVIQFGTVSLTTPVTVGSISLTTSSANLGIVYAGTDSVTGDFSNSGTVGVDFGISSGTTLTIGGTLTNSGTGSFNIGWSGLTVGTTVTAAALSNAGTINLTGSASAQATLNVAGAAPATLIGNVSLSNSALLEFGSGAITGIASGATLGLLGFNGQPRVAISGNTGTNSALTQLSSNAGTLTLFDTAPLTTDPGVNFSNSGNASLNGGTLALGGILTNSGAFTVGNNGNVASALSAAGFSNTGTFDVASFPTVFGSPLPTSATFGGAAPSTITGRVRLFGNASLQFTGGGSINSIASGATLEIDTWRGSQPSLTGVSGLTSNAGTLNLDARNFSGNGWYGGMNLSFSGAVTNTGTINYGNVVVNNGDDLVTMAGFTNTGNLVMIGGQTSGVTLNITGAAPATLTGDNYLQGNAVLQYGSGSITAIGSGAVLDLNGGRVGLNGQGGNSALTHLASNAGGLHIAISGGIITDTPFFSNTNFVQVDQGVLALGGSLANSAIFQVRGGTVSAAGVNNTGTLTIGNFGAATLNAGYEYRQTAGSTTVNGGSLSAQEVTVGGGSLVFATPLTSAAGTGPITLIHESLVEFATTVDSSEQVGFGGPGTIQVDDGFHFAGTIFHFTGADEAVDIRNLSDVNHDAHTSFNFLTNQLTVFGDNGTVTLQLDAENYSGVSWSTQQDAVGGTLLTASFAPGSQYVFFAPGQPMNAVTTTDPNNVPPPAPGNFNLEVVVNATGTGSYMTAPGYQGLAIRSADGHTLSLLHGDYGAVDNGAGNTIFLGDGSESIGGAIGDTIQGGSGPNQFLDGHVGHQSITGGSAGNETIWGAATDTVRGGSGGNETIAGVSGETTFGSTGANVFINATGGNQSVLGGSAGNDSVWTAAGDTIHGGSNNETVGGVAGVTMIGGTGGDQFFDASQGHQSILGGSGGNETIWGAATDTITGGSGGNETIGGVSGETVLGGSGANVFFNATGGNQSIVGGSAGNMTVWSGAGDTIRGGSDNETIGGVPNDTVIGGSGANSFIDGSQGHQSILGGTGGNETIWGAATDTITGGSGGNETIGGVSGETILGGAANTFFDATAGNESIVAGTGNTTVWGGTGDTVQGASGSGTALIGFAGGNETFWDDGATAGRHDSISTFSQAGGDRVSLNGATDTPSNVVASATTSGGNTTVTFHDGSTLTFIGISSVNNGFFTTH